MALWRKTFSNLGGTDYVPDARVEEAQRQEQLNLSRKAADRQFMLAQRQLQQQSAQGAWKNKLALEQLNLERQRSNFQYGADAQTLRQQQAQLPWAQLDQQGRQFDARQGLARDELGLQQQKFDYARAMGASPEEAATLRELGMLLQQNELKRSNATNSDPVLAALERSLVAEGMGSAARNDPDAIAALNQAKVREAQASGELANVRLQDELSFGPAREQAKVDMLQEQARAMRGSNDLNDTFGPSERAAGLEGSVQQNRLRQFKVDQEDFKARMLDAYPQLRADAALGEVLGDVYQFQQLQLGNELAVEQLASIKDKRAQAAREQQLADAATALAIMQDDSFTNLTSGTVDLETLEGRIFEVLSVTPPSQRPRLIAAIRAAEPRILAQADSLLNSAGQLLAWGDRDARLKGEAAQARALAKQKLERALIPFER